MRYFVAVPTYNGGNTWSYAAENIKKHAPEGTYVQVVDSGSRDSTVEISKQFGFDVVCIDSNQFNHGGTRNRFVELNPKYDVVIFLTQDAIPEPDYINHILSAFDDPDVACAYGRQLPHTDANLIAQHARYFNYPEQSHVYNSKDAPNVGLKTVFMSNSFSAYRIDIFRELGGFPSDTILCEDMYFTAKAVLAGYKVAYVAEAMAKHSHNYTPMQEFKRYFDIGVFHHDEPWIKESFGGAGGEGRKFLFSEFSFLIKEHYTYIPLSMMNNLMKIIGYKLGGKYKKIPVGLIKKLSMHKVYWE